MQLASRLDIPVYPSFGKSTCPKADFVLIGFRQSVSCVGLFNSALTSHSDVAPVNAFQRNTSGHESQWAFDTQSAGWKVSRLSVDLILLNLVAMGRLYGIPANQVSFWLLFISCSGNEPGVRYLSLLSAL